METNLRQRALSGTIWSATQKFGLSILMFLSNIVLARKLTPDDFGCIGMLSIFITISNALVYGGFVSALIQKKEAENKDYSTVFYWNIFISIFLYFILFISSPIIARFYGIERLSLILRVQGIVLILNGLGVVQMTIVRRHLDFKKLAIANIVSSILSVSTAIVLAYAGAGIWALVFQQLSFSLLNCLIFWFSTSWHPALVFSIDSFRSMFSYGSFLLLNDLINSFCDNIQGLFIGKQFNSATMGYYTQAKRLEEVPTQSISQVVAQVTFPIYSRIQNEKERLRHAVKETLLLMNYLNFPLMLLLIAVAKPLFIILFSDKWLESVPYFQILCVAGIVNCMQSVNYQVVSAGGRSRELFLWNIVKRGAGVFLMVIGLIYGVKGLLWGMVVSFYFIYVINAWLAYPVTGYSIYTQIKDNFPILIIALVSFLGSFLLQDILISNLPLLLLQVIVFILIYLSLSFVFKRKELGMTLSIINNLVHRND